MDGPAEGGKPHCVQAADNFMRYIKISFCGIIAVWFCFCGVYTDTPPAVYTFATDTGYLLTLLNKMKGIKKLPQVFMKIYKAITTMPC